MKAFLNRSEAGRQLAKALAYFKGRDDVTVLGLPRGGVVVACEAARGLKAPLDVLVVRKLGVPGHEELGMGAIASGGVRVLNEDVVRMAGITEAVIEQATARELRELGRRERAYRANRPFPDLHGRTVILVDDGLATGATMRAAVAAVRVHHPAKVVVAVPTAALDTCETLRKEVDELVCLTMPEPFFGVGAWYEDFAQTTDDEVRDLLEQARQWQGIHPRVQEP